jgi:hypothetical protein
VLSVRKKFRILMVGLIRAQFGEGHRLTSGRRHAKEGLPPLPPDENDVSDAPGAIPAGLVANDDGRPARERNLLKFPLRKERNVLAIRRPERALRLLGPGKRSCRGGIEWANPDLWLSSF